jgi:hypothetical protein
MGTYRLTWTIHDVGRGALGKTRRSERSSNRDGHRCWRSTVYLRAPHFAGNLPRAAEQHGRPVALGSLPGPLTVAGARPVEHQLIRVSIVIDAGHHDRGGRATVGKWRSTDKSSREDERKGSYQSCAAHARISTGEANPCDEELSANPNQGRHSLPEKRTRSDW